MASGGNSQRARFRQQLRIGRQVIRGHQTIALAAHEQRRHVSPMKPMLELRIVHPRFPREQRQRLAVADHNGQLLIRHLREIRLHPCGIVEQQLAQLILRHREYIRDVELVGAANLDADRPDHDQTANALRRLGRHLSRDPPADRAARDINHTKLETIQQFEIEMGDIVDAVEPVRQAGPTKAGMRGHDQTAPCRKQRDKLCFWIESLTAMQPKQRWPLPGLEHFDFNSGDLNCCCFQANRLLAHRSLASRGLSISDRGDKL